MKYVDSLHIGDTAYAWCGDIRRSVTILEIGNRTITTTPIEPMTKQATFGRYSGKGCGNTSSGYHLASAVGENEVEL